MEVVMNDRSMAQVDVRAAKSLILWKAMFAEEVRKQASQFADSSDNQDTIPISQYRRAAAAALQNLLAAIQHAENSDTQTKSA
ncbi:MAG: hypothetical protein U1D30_04755 [Planctomycetota bacterium]